jgi:hypothetical protein
LRRQEAATISFGSRRGERRVVPQNRKLESSQFRTRIQAELVS